MNPTTLECLLNCDRIEHIHTNIHVMFNKMFLGHFLAYFFHDICTFLCPPMLKRPKHTHIKQLQFVSCVRGEGEKNNVILAGQMCGVNLIV